MLKYRLEKYNELVNYEKKRSDDIKTNINKELSPELKEKIRNTKLQIEQLNVSMKTTIIYHLFYNRRIKSFLRMFILLKFLIENAQNTIRKNEKPQRRIQKNATKYRQPTGNIVD